MPAVRSLILVPLVFAANPARSADTTINFVKPGTRITLEQSTPACRDEEMLSRILSLMNEGDSAAATALVVREQSNKMCGLLDVGKELIVIRYLQTSSPAQFLIARIRPIGDPDEYWAMPVWLVKDTKTAPPKVN